MANNHQISAKYTDQGYWVKRYPDHTITVGYKDEEREFMACPEELATQEGLDLACQRHMARIAEPAEVTQ